MPTTTIEDAQARLAAWISKLKPGEELVIIQKDRPVARLVAEPPPANQPRKSGSAIGILTIVEDDGSHLEDFREYMP
jgi:antitoxin (DNA-binding transcriptional repressor) of toxin-antitoxin stability system